MKISVASDVHLEFGDLDIVNDQDADVLILSGDILVARDLGQRDSYNIRGEHDRSNRFHAFFERCASRFPHVIYILGNHEHYHGDFATTHRHLKDMLAYLPNVYILDREIKEINGVTFIGATLWTDMNRGDALTLYQIRSRMNDFRCVANSNRMVSFKAYEQINGVDDREKPIFKERAAKFSPEDAAEEHAKAKEYIRLIIEDRPGQDFVVVGHHAPSYASIHPKYAHDQIMNGGYASAMDEFILDHPQIRLWTHGHTHHEFDYMIGSTRVLCNPRGYINYEEQAERWKLKTLEITPRREPLANVDS